MSVKIKQIAIDPKASPENNLFGVGEDGVVYQYDFVDSVWLSLQMDTTEEAYEVPSKV